MAAVLIVGLAIWATHHRPDSVKGLPQLPSAPMPVAGVASELDRILVDPIRVGPIRIIDQLSDDPLDVEVTLVSAERGELLLTSGDHFDLSGELDRANLRYPLASGELVQDLSLNAVAQWVDDTWTLRLPYTARVSVTLRSPGLNAESPPGQFMLLPDFGPFLEEVELNASLELPNLPLQSMTFEGKARWFLRAGSLQPIGQVDSPTWDTASISHPAEGLHILGWVNEFGDSAFIPVELIPGVAVNYELYPRLRPVLRGILLDWHGEPVPEAPISFITSLDLVDYDNMPQDPHAMVTYKRDGQYFKTMKQTYKTDKKGRFERRVPRGQDYALWSHALGGYCFWSTRLAGVRFAETEEIILQLQEPTADNATIFQIQWPNGSPFTRGRVTVAPAGDVPFFRQWPYRVPLDEWGEIQLVGFQPGILVGVRIYLEGDDWLHSSYAAPYVNVPENRRVEVRLTEDALRKKNL